MNTNSENFKLNMNELGQQLAMAFTMGNHGAEALVDKYTSPMGAYSSLVSGIIEGGSEDEGGACELVESEIKEMLADFRGDQRYLRGAVRRYLQFRWDDPHFYSRPVTNEFDFSVVSVAIDITCEDFEVGEMDKIVAAVKALLKKQMGPDAAYRIDDIELAGPADATLFFTALKSDAVKLLTDWGYEDELEVYLVNPF